MLSIRQAIIILLAVGCGSAGEDGQARAGVAEDSRTLSAMYQEGRLAPTDPVLVTAKNNAELQNVIALLKRARWSVAKVETASVERYHVPPSAGEADQSETVTWSRLTLRATLKNEALDVIFAMTDGGAPTVLFQAKTGGAEKLLKDALSKDALSKKTEVQATSQPRKAAGPTDACSAVAASSCETENYSCESNPCCAGYYCGYNNSSDLHCYCQRSFWECSYTSSTGSGHPMCRTEDNPAGLFHVITWRRGCQNGTGLYADYRGNAVACPDPETASGGYPMCD